MRLKYEDYQSKMNIETNNAILKFAKIISGAYSNELQSQSFPKDFAHINIFFRPIDWSIMNGPGLYSEQIYNYSPWSPYRQALHKIYMSQGILKVENYMLKNKERIAGAGNDKKLLEELHRDKILIRPGCTMLFKLIKESFYIGNIEEGNKCILHRDGKETYLVSKVELREDSLISEDSGIDKETNQKVWGSENGAFIFKKTRSFKEDINEKWINEL